MSNLKRWRILKNILQNESQQKMLQNSEVLQKSHRILKNIKFGEKLAQGEVFENTTAKNLMMKGKENNYLLETQKMVKNLKNTSGASEADTKSEHSATSKTEDEAPKSKEAPDKTKKIDCKPVESKNPGMDKSGTNLDTNFDCAQYGKDLSQNFGSNFNKLKSNIANINKNIFTTHPNVNRVEKNFIPKITTKDRFKNDEPNNVDSSNIGFTSTTTTDGTGFNSDYFSSPKNFRFMRKVFGDSAEDYSISEQSQEYILLMRFGESANDTGAKSKQSNLGVLINKNNENNKFYDAGNKQKKSGDATDFINKLHLKSVKEEPKDKSKKFKASSKLGKKTKKSNTKFLSSYINKPRSSKKKRAKRRKFDARFLHDLKCKKIQFTKKLSKLGSRDAKFLTNYFDKIDIKSNFLCNAVFPLKLAIGCPNFFEMYQNKVGNLSLPLTPPISNGEYIKSNSKYLPKPVCFSKYNFKLKFTNGGDSVSSQFVHPIDELPQKNNYSSSSKPIPSYQTKYDMKITSKEKDCFDQFFVPDDFDTLFMKMHNAKKSKLEMKKPENIFDAPLDEPVKDADKIKDKTLDDVLDSFKNKMLNKNAPRSKPKPKNCISHIKSKPPSKAEDTGKNKKHSESNQDENPKDKSTSDKNTKEDNPKAQSPPTGGGANYTDMITKVIRYELNTVQVYQETKNVVVEEVQQIVDLNKFDTIARFDNNPTNPAGGGGAIGGLLVSKNKKVETYEKKSDGADAKAKPVVDKLTKDKAMDVDKKDIEKVANEKEVLKSLKSLGKHEDLKKAAKEFDVAKKVVKTKKPEAAQDASDEANIEEVKSNSGISKNKKRVSNDKIDNITKSDLHKVEHKIQTPHKNINNHNDTIKSVDDRYVHEVPECCNENLTNVNFSHEPFTNTAEGLNKMDNKSKKAEAINLAQKFEDDVNANDVFADSAKTKTDAKGVKRGKMFKNFDFNTLSHFIKHGVVKNVENKSKKPKKSQHEPGLDEEYDENELLDTQFSNPDFKGKDQPDERTLSPKEREQILQIAESVLPKVYDVPETKSDSVKKPEKVLDIKLPKGYKKSSSKFGKDKLLLITRKIQGKQSKSLIEFNRTNLNLKDFEDDNNNIVDKENVYNKSENWQKTVNKTFQKLENFKGHRKH